MADPVRSLYILNKHGLAVRAKNLTQWAVFMAKRHLVRVAFDDLEERGEVSTVFVGIDYNFSDDGPPILWESLVSGGPFANQRQRYCSQPEALAGHRAIVQLLMQCNTGMGQQRHQQPDQDDQPQNRAADVQPRLGDGQHADDPEDHGGDDQHDQ
jgi:hypothetical protein